MLYETFNSLKEAHGEDYFTSRLDSEVEQNLNPNFELREYQKEAIGRFDFYFNGYQKRQFPAHLLFNMATGSGKTLIMAANILSLYKCGYRNFIFFVDSVNIREKTKDNFLNQVSDKYLFAQKIKIDDKDVFIKSVQNFEAANGDDINILFATIQGLHIRLNEPKENSPTYTDFENKNIALISDEAHHLQALTKSQSQLTKTEKENKSSWEYTVERVLHSNPKNILLEFTATIDLSNQYIRQKYKEKILYQYDLKQFRLDKFSKEIEVLQADLDPIDRALQAAVLSQYRRKIAEKYGVNLKPVILLKSKSIKDSKENFEGFLNKINDLVPDDIKEIKSRANGTDLSKAFDYFQEANITFDNIIKEIQDDFSEEKCMLLDSENVDDEKQIKLNSLESKYNNIRTIFAVGMLNEGWDVLNLFDIVRLYDTRDGKWVGGRYKPGKTTIGEAQLIGRGARYFPFQLNENEDKYIRKFDDDIENELRIIETLHYHSFHNLKYIDELKSALTEMGIIAEKHVQLDLLIKDSFKKTEMWKNGLVFVNRRIDNPRTDIFGLESAGIEKSYSFKFRTGEQKEEIIFANSNNNQQSAPGVTIRKGKYRLLDFGENVIRCALDRIEFFKFNKLKKYFPHIKSIREFITDTNYLGSVKIEVTGPKEKVKNLSATEKINLALMVVKNVSNQAKANTSDYKGSELFKAKLLKEVFKDKKIKIDIDDVESKKMNEVALSDKDWYAQNDFYGTDEERNFISFIDGFINGIKKEYSNIALLRNEKYFQVFDFDEGRAFEPDFIMFLIKENKVVNIYQVFVEPKGDQFKDREGGFVNSKEWWKEKYLLEIEDKSDTDFNSENKHFKLVGLPFYNEKLKADFEKAFKDKFSIC